MNRRALCGGQEITVSNLSFARIMYGTNEDTRSFARMSSPGLSAAADSAGVSNASTKVEGTSLEGLLHKVWAALSFKN
jgi:hypothetical protein